MRGGGWSEEAVSENVSRRRLKRRGSERVFIANDGGRHVGMDAWRPLTRQMSPSAINGARLAS